MGVKFTLLPILTTAGLLAAWEALSISGVFPPELPPVSAVAAWLLAALATTELWTAVGFTLMHWFVALAIGFGAGAAIGVVMASIPSANELLLGTVEFFRPIPVVVYLPIMLLLFGARSQVVIMLAAVAATWPILLQTLYGVNAVDSVTRDTARVYGLTARQRLMWVTAPSVLPYWGTGLRIASSITLLAAIAVELIGAIPGLGNTLNAYAANGVYPATYGVIVLTGLLGVSLNKVFEMLEHRVLRWHPSHRVVAV